MRVILKNEIVGLGEEGEIVKVSNGYARNFLFPKREAVEYNSQNVTVLKSQKKAIDKRREERKVAYMSLKERIETISLTIRMKAGESGHLFGAVTSTTIADELEKLDIQLFKKQLVVPHHSIKEVGQYSIEVKLQAGITATLQLVVEATEDSANTTSKSSASHRAKKAYATSQPEFSSAAASPDLATSTFSAAATAEEKAPDSALASSTVDKQEPSASTEGDETTVSSVEE